MDSPASPPEKKDEDGPVIAITGLSEAGAADEPGSAGEPGNAIEPGATEAARTGEDVAIEPAAIEAARTGEDVALPGTGDAAAPEVEATPAAAWSPSLVFMSVIAFVVAVADLGTKEWAKWALAGPDLRRGAKRIEAIPDYLDFIFAQNPGGAWSFLRSVPDGLRRPFFLFVSAAAIVFIVSVYRRLDRRQWAMRWGLPLALGGAIGNLTDRVRYGWVCDFIDVYWRRGGNEMHWPTFNVADIAIVAGVGLMALDLFSLRRMKGPEPQAAAETAGGAA